MDVLAATALATEAPHPKDLRAEIIRENDNVISPAMWR